MIEVHEQLATVTSRYEFSVDGRVRNDGSEVWSLVEIKGDWKLVAVTWTTHLRPGG